MNAPTVSLPRFWSQLSTRDFAALDVAATVAVLPLGATEQHGPHLPLGVDTVLADGIVAAALPLLPAELPVLFLPTQQIGLSPEHARFAGTLTLSSETLIRMWSEIGAGVARAGVKKLVLFNAHGGHVGAMDIVARELRAAHGLIVYSASWFNLPLGEAGARFSAHEHRFGVHAGEIETSMMLALAPQLVRMDAAQDFRSSSEQRAADYAILGNGRSAKLGWAIEDYNAQGAAGNAAAATASAGQAVVDAAAAQLALLLAEVSRLPLSTANTGPLP
ncbi:creatininase [Variovorax paradoxus]|jgi:creatinine amidohydrolase|uniref:creatininase family protein n=1 Tax=Variovorax TaxID=34072 RepID=UPI0006E61E2D|nr:creatininase [Variovorax paradoxus]KPV09826.1 creatininase [Variovorax paradoxus]KPV12580.1 creatininase [Variovorax paradoxus]KPV22139.1 creatininase [Variovorax paradoxus]KPV34476.1 creatininase [Variovorax paradoxus]